MATYTKIPLSQSNYGKSTLITLSALPGINIHTTDSASNITDEIWVYASNNGSSDSLTTFYWGSTATQDLIAQINVQAYAGLTVIFPGMILKGDGSNTCSIYTYTQYPSAVNITGYVNRITS